MAKAGTNLITSAPYEPMLAGTCIDIKTLAYPKLVSTKIDGIRAYIKDGVVMSRTHKPIPNVAVQRKFGKRKYNGLDGELIAGSPTADDAFNYTQSIVMSKNKPAANVHFYVFDDVSKRAGFKVRLQSVIDRVAKLADTDNVIVVPHLEMMTPQKVSVFEEECLLAGYEGVMLRDPNGPYKYGRSTVKEGWLLKLKRFEDSEARIEGWKELHNEAGEPQGKMGAVIGVDIHNGKKVDCGIPSEAAREALWRNRKQLTGLVFRYKFFPLGSKDRPRFPTWGGFDVTKEPRSKK